MRYSTYTLNSDLSKYYVKHEIPNLHNIYPQGIKFLSKVTSRRKITILDGIRIMNKLLDEMYYKLLNQ